MLAAQRGQPVIFRTAVVSRLAPFGVDQALQLQPVQRRIKRPLFHAQHLIGDLLDELRDTVPVHPAAREGFENQNVEGDLHELAAGPLFYSSPRAVTSHRRLIGSMRQPDPVCQCYRLFRVKPSAMMTLSLRCRSTFNSPAPLSRSG